MLHGESPGEREIAYKFESKLLRAAGTPDSDLLDTLVMRIAGKRQEDFAVGREHLMAKTPA